MKFTYRPLMAGLPLLAISAGPPAPQTLNLSITIPQQDGFRSHPPYVAVYLESASGPAKTLSVWYMTNGRKDGRRWLSEVRSWWRASGSTMSFPADGISGATRAPGTHTLSYTVGTAPLGTLAKGKYNLVVEAVREHGGADLLTLPFTWPAKPGATTSASGKSELGMVTLTLR